MRELGWQNFRELAQLFQRLENLLEQAFLAPSSALSPPQPLVDVYETPEAVVVEAELPGTRADKVTVQLDGQRLLLAGFLGEQNEPEETRFLRMERPRGRFQRVLPLPVPVAPPFEAQLASGVLVVRLPKAVPAARTVPVTREGA